MLKITMKIDGMMCGMCGNHVNDAVRKVFPVKKGYLIPQQRGDRDSDRDGHFGGTAPHSH